MGALKRPIFSLKVMASIYGNGLTPFPSPKAAISASPAESQLSPPTTVSVNWGSIEPHHFDFDFGTDVCLRSSEKGPYEYRAVRVSGAGMVKQAGFAEKKFENGIILVQRLPGGKVRCFEPEPFMRAFQRADGTPLQIIDEIAFQTPDKGLRPSVAAPSRAA